MIWKLEAEFHHFAAYVDEEYKDGPATFIVENSHGKPNRISRSAVSVTKAKELAEDEMRARHRGVGARQK